MCFSEDEIYEVIQKMKAHGVRKTLVIDSSRSLVGIVVLGDLLHLIGNELQALSGVMKEEIDKEDKSKRKASKSEQLAACPRLKADYSGCHAQI